MKKFIITILCVSAFFVGIGAVVQKVGAMFRSDSKAVIILKKSQVSIGGETKIKMIKSLSAHGKAVSMFQVNGAERPREGKFEMSLMLPNQMSKMIEMRFEGDLPNKIKNDDPQQAQGFIVKGPDDLKKKFEGDNEKPFDIIRDNEPGKKGETKERTNLELLRTVFGLFFTAPDNLNVSYFYDGEEIIDGTAAEIVECKIENNSVAKLYLSKSSNLPLMMSYQDSARPKVVEFDGLNDDQTPPKDITITNRTRSDDKIATYTVRFSDYRAVNGVLFPFQWVQTADGRSDQTVTIDSYEINPPNIEDKFKPQEIRIRTRKPE